MATRITHFYHDSQQLPDPAPVLGTSFDIADVHVHDLAPGQRPVVINSRNWYGKLESLYIRLTSIGAATKVTIRITADANGDVVLIPDTEADLVTGITTATTGSAMFSVDLPCFLLESFPGNGTLYVFAKVDAGTPTWSESVLAWSE
jgi:hypothetical protein